MRRVALAAAFAAGLAMTGQATAQDVTYEVLGFDDLQGWDKDDHNAALTAFLETCRDMKDPDWASLCALAGQQKNAKTFFELFFKPVLIEDGKPMLFTGYFEPELNGSPVRTAKYRYPLYRKPPEVRN